MCAAAVHDITLHDIAGTLERWTTRLLPIELTEAFDGFLMPLYTTAHDINNSTSYNVPYV